MAGMNKTHMTETDIITKYILPAVKDAGWNRRCRLIMLSGVWVIPQAKLHYLRLNKN
ncbi:hypothetical protein [Providencia sp. PROV075]|uniref:hypothetical protein n=1 Tax=Providencia sp. PROV075 TaxID=2949797 RepID=UPI00234B3ECE|nr:hypothetical protein [Providencia sp. PROV075]